MVIMAGTANRIVAGERRQKRINEKEISALMEVDWDPSAVRGKRTL